MLILAIETATSSVSVAIVRQLTEGEVPQVLGRFEVQGSRRHAETLMPAIELLSAQSETPLRSLDRIAVDTGPGLFTGLRVGVTTAITLAMALDIGVAAISSLAALWQSCRYLVDAPTLVPVLDARRAEVYAAAYGRSGEMVMEPLVGPAQDVFDQLPPGSVVVGEGAWRYSNVFVCPSARLPKTPDAVAVAELGLSAPIQSCDAIDITYLRPPDADLPASRPASARQP